MSGVGPLLAYMGLMLGILVTGLCLDWSGDTLLLKLRGPVWFRVPLLRLTIHLRGLLFTAAFFFGGCAAVDHQLISGGWAGAALSGLSFFFLAMGSDDHGHKRSAHDAVSEEDGARLTSVLAPDPWAAG